jgi:hypothetical protein
VATRGNAGAWWSEQKLSPGGGLAWQLGQLEVAVHRLEGEWQVAWRRAEDADENPDRKGFESISALPENLDNLERYAARDAQRSLRCLPAPADRSVVARPQMPLFVPSGEEILIFVSSPAWLQIGVGKPWKVIRELPVKRLSDTWFGSSTREGELAYALRTQGRVHQEEIPFVPHRVVTPVLIRNEGADTLSVERLNLPVPYLSVYATSSEQLWTEKVTMNRSEDQQMAALEIGKGPPSTARGARRLNAARRTAEENVLVRAFSSLLQSFAGGEDQ